MYAYIRDKAIAFHQTFNKSAVIWFARFQVLFGVVLEVLVHTDLSPVLGNPKYITYWLVISGILTETMRRHGTTTDDQNRLVPPGDHGDHE